MKRRLADILWRWVERLAPAAASDCIHARALDMIREQMADEQARRAVAAKLKGDTQLITPTTYAPDWTAQHQGEWARFLRTPTGEALLARMRAVGYANLVGAAAADARPQAVHRAGGWQEATTWLESLSRAALRDIEADNDTGGAEGDSGIRERLTP